VTPDLRAEPTVPRDDPAVVAELARRSRVSGVVLVALSAVVLPGWAPFDLYLEPDHASLFITVRLLAVLPLAVLVALLVAAPVGRRHPELLSVLALGVVQADVLWMVTQVDQVASYGLGLSLALFGCGGVFAGGLRWTVLLAGGTWAGAAVAVAANDQPVSGAQLVTLAVYLSTATVVALVTHTVRQTLSVREVRTTVGLHREQQRTAVLMARLERLSHEDPLTGLANRRRWDAELAAACAAGSRDGQPVAVLLLDIDHFKQVNDRYGHAGGDAALQAVAGLLREAVRGSDVVARLGGDELAVLLPGTDAARAVELAEQLRSATLALRLPGFAPGGLSVSLGVAVADGDDVDPAALTARADRCLYTAKATRNAVGTVVGVRAASA
jgi:diguanylate cyclase (GGDEF)-like protein